MLNKYFTVRNVYYEDYSTYYDVTEWKGFEICEFIRMLHELEELISNICEKIEEKQLRKDINKFKVIADKTDREFIDGFEM